MRRPLRPAANSTANSTANSAFTLMELLVVISIIMILMGMLFAGISLAKEAATRAKSQATLQQLRAALESYRQTSGKYPEGGTGGTFDSILGANPIYINISTPNWEAINIELIRLFKEVGVSDFKSPQLDGWKKPFHYRPARYLPFDPAAVEDIDKDDPPGRDSYQLWSMGKNLTDDAGRSGSDDLTSWTSK